MSNTAQSEALQTPSVRSPMKPGEKFTADAKLRALTNYAEFGQMIRAARAAGINPRTINRHIAKDPEFRDQWDLAKQTFIETIVEEARDQALNGTLVKKYNRDGKIQSEQYVKSVPLIMFLLRAHDPETFGDRKHIEHKTSVSHEHMLTLDVSKLDPEQREAMRKLLGPGTQEPTTTEDPSPESTDDQ